MSSSQGIVVAFREVKRFMIDVLVRRGADARHAAQLSDVLASGDYRGQYGHGLNRLPLYIRELQSGVCAGRGEPRVLKDRPASAWVDGANLLGPVVGNFCMDIAMAKARQVGVGWVTAKGSNHFGIAAWYTMRAADQGLMGLAFTNTTPLMLPTGSTQVALGTNAMSLAAPGLGSDQFVLDMATTAVASGKLEIAKRKGESIPLGWAADARGHGTTDPSAALKGGGLLPLGGSEATGGYKGYGLAAMVELLCGVSAGAAWGPHVRKWTQNDRFANLGQCFIAVDPDSFAPGFREETQEFMDTLRSLEPVDSNKPVQAAGDPEREHMNLCDQLGGIPYHPSQITRAFKLANDNGIQPMEAGEAQELPIALHA